MGGGPVSCAVARLTMAAAIVSAIVVLEGSVAAAAATNHVVGGTNGWTIPPNTTFYSEWSSTETFTAGDTLVFNFLSSIHNVIEVPKSSYDACTSQSQIGSTQTSTPATITITSGNHYYICGVNGHCSAGQKLSINVVSSSSTSSPAPLPMAGSPAPALPSAPGPSSTSDVPPTTSAPGPSSTSDVPPTTSALGPSISGSTHGSTSAPSLTTKAATIAFLLLAAAYSFLL